MDDFKEKGKLIAIAVQGFARNMASAGVFLEGKTIFDTSKGFASECADIYDEELEIQRLAQYQNVGD